MPRGKPSQDGDTYTSANGYHYTKVDGKHRLTHHIIAERQLGRPIAHDETVSFVDGNRENLSPDNIKVSKRKTSLRGRIAALESKKMEIEGELANLYLQLAKQSQHA